MRPAHRTLGAVLAELHTAAANYEPGLANWRGQAWREAFANRVRARIEIDARTVLTDVVLGASIAVNGCCLTLVAQGDGWWEADLSPETLARTCLGALAPGDVVNLDITVIKNGFHGDTSRMFCVGAPSVQARRLCDITYECMWRGIATVRAGSRLGDIGHRCAVVAAFVEYSCGGLEDAQSLGLARFIRTVVGNSAIGHILHGGS